MPWLRVVPTDGEHVCVKPPLEPYENKQYGPGSKWICPTCTTCWQIVEWVTPAGWSELHPVWKIFSP